LFAVIATYIAYRVTLALIRHFTERRTVPRLFLDAGARALGVVTSLMVLQAMLKTAPDDLPLLPLVKQTTLLLLILAMTWAAVRLTSVIGEVIVLLNDDVVVADGVRAVEKGRPVVISGRLYRLLDPLFQSVLTRRLFRIGPAK
jgi:hypothetical protein